MGEVLGAAVLAEGRRRAGGGVGETQAESLVGDAVEAVVDVVGESSVAGEPGVGTPGGGVAHRGRLLEGDADAAARGVFDGLFVLVVEVVEAQTAGWGEAVSKGADTKANIREPVRATGGLLEFFQRRVALQPVSESGSCLGAEVVVSQTASTGAEVGAEAYQGALTRKQTLLGRRRT